MKIFDKTCTNYFLCVYFNSSFFLNHMKRRRKELRLNNIPSVRASNEFKTIACNMRVTLHNHQLIFIEKYENS